MRGFMVAASVDGKTIVANLRHSGTASESPSAAPAGGPNQPGSPSGREGP